MELPFIDFLRVDQSKITDYLLNEVSSRGKATFFLHLGFRVEEWETLAAALKVQARDNPVTSIVDSPYGKTLQCGRPYRNAAESATPPRVQQFRFWKTGRKRRG